MRKEPMKIGDLLKKYNLLVLLIVFIVIITKFPDSRECTEPLAAGINTGNRSHWYDPCNHHLRY